MNFVFTARFILAFTGGLVVFSLGWVNPALLWAGLCFDLALIGAALVDAARTPLRGSFTVRRTCAERFALGSGNTVTIEVKSHSPLPLTLWLKDEHPPEMEVQGREGQFVLPARGTAALAYELTTPARGRFQFGDIAVRLLSPWGLVWRQTSVPAAESVKVYPDFRAAQRQVIEAYRVGRQGERRQRLRGQGREFESLREFVTGDELRHVAWAASARRGKLVTRQYQIERSQSIILMVDCGRLMTARIGNFTKLDYAVNAALAVAYVAVAGGDQAGLLTFTRRVDDFLPPKPGAGQLGTILELLHDVQPQMLEPSYARAFAHINRYCRRRSLVILLTDVVDADASSDLLAHTASLIPRHLPLIVTIGDRDLRAFVKPRPASLDDVYAQSVAEELLAQREQALNRITELGGLALDVPTGQLSPALVNRYLEVKTRGLI
ncbi:MAG: DUF58 domain-containing protein [Chloracidobacterium sp.]|uniref:DUF58 domain-containing protein n=1 Tax=Chloracidobacterium validum TaxID=2821543 RepID=A0ABX8B4V5_9BACT|nr:DUF58 domain-containing protein [Chloracidobacterium validum]QUW01953.1 DUF58 domain-containing protein [Chloracidobacterium validum]